MAVVCLGFDLARLGDPLDGFGFLVPRGEGQRMLGALWDSSIYPGRAPKNAALIRVMLGGSHDPEAALLDEETLAALARQGLAETMGLRAEPIFQRVFRHPLGIPQYTVGHLDRLARIESRLERLPGLSVAGNAFRGVAINTCVADAGPLAERLIRDLA
jgi:oxygen-dependent protoporphyrinogen oxidase